MAETHQQARQTVLASDAALSGEWFTKASMQKEGGYSLEFVTVLLNMMAHEGQLQRTIVNRVAHFKVASITHRRMERMPWRRHTNKQLKVLEYDRSTIFQG